MYNTELYNFITEKKHHAFRGEGLPSRAEEYKAEGLSPRERMTRRFCKAADREAQSPHILPGQKIVLMRTVTGLPDVLTEDEWAEVKNTSHVHELGYISNICPDYMSVISKGFGALRESVDECSRRVLDALSGICDSYRRLAAEQGRDDIVRVLERVPEHPAGTFREALQFFRILHYALWLEGDYHNTIGRFDRFMMPYLQRDLDSGVLSEDEAKALLEDFFLSFNIDSDLYPGIQQGDNGQSMMLGGRTEDGTEVYNLLTQWCMEVCGELKLIDPKINLRVSKSTPLSIFVKATELTKLGLGFPQYSNDDVVIDGLVRLGYDYADAVNYTVAACWEFIIPGAGTDIANIAALSYPKCVDRAVRKSLASAESMDDLLDAVKREITAECDAITDSIKSVWFVPSPMMDVLYGGIDVSKGAKYNNFGVHGTGIACAADSLAAIDRYFFTEKRWTAAELIDALDRSFEGCDEMRAALRYESPKCGQGEDAADKYLAFLTETFSGALAGRRNCRGGIWRAGTGSAMYYLWHAAEIGASPDGRCAGEPFGANYSPSIFADTADPVKVIKSFTTPELCKVINGGPLTLEFSDKVFAGKDAITKTAMLVKYFIDCGGHQLQLNAVDRDKLIDAQKNPEKYRRLIVRIWGWSAYFCELDKEYQDHVIRRHEYVV